MTHPAGTDDRTPKATDQLRREAARALGIREALVAVVAAMVLAIVSCAPLLWAPDGGASSSTQFLVFLGAVAFVASLVPTALSLAIGTIRPPRRHRLLQRIVHLLLGMLATFVLITLLCALLGSTEPRLLLPAVASYAGGIIGAPLIVGTIALAYGAFAWRRAFRSSPDA